MDKTGIIGKLRASAAYLRETRIPVGEKTTIERLLSCALALDNLADELEEENAHEADNK